MGEWLYIVLVNALSGEKYDDECKIWVNDLFPPNVNSIVRGIWNDDLNILGSLITYKDIGLGTWMKSFTILLPGTHVPEIIK
jgi:hypothetical protein